MASSSPAPPPPPHHLESDPSSGTRSISLHGWTITTTKLPILSIPESDAAAERLDLALPEIIFGNNSLTLCHESSGFEVRYDAEGLLGEVKKGKGWESQTGSGAVSVAHADEWKRGQSSSTSTTASLTIQKPFDWTYTTLHPGSYTLPLPRPSTSTSSSSAPRQPAPFHPAPASHSGIPLSHLSRTDIPILFFDEVPLFEDELGDNGIADATVRVRVNSYSLYVLLRFSLRIDNVLFRHFDVRLFHFFSPPSSPSSPSSSASSPGEIIRQTKGREAPYPLVRDRIIGPSPSPRRRAPPPSAPSPPPSRTVGVTLPNRSPFAAAARPSPTGSPAPSSSLLAGETQRGAEDLSLLNDIDRVAAVLDLLALEEGVGGVSIDGQGAEGKREGEGEDRWEGLGVKLEVMQLPSTTTTSTAEQEAA